MSSLKVALPVINLACAGGGAVLVEHVIKELPGVVDVYMNPATETAYVEYLPEKLTQEEMAQAIKKVGYKALLPATVLREVKS